MEEEKITLDRGTFKVLASGTRVEILKSLDRRRKTLSELSKQFGMSVSTIKEHLETLVNAELIVQDDDGHKWKYYDLTRKGKSILHPEDRRVWILLGVSVIGIFASVYDLFSNTIFASFAGTRALSAPKEMDEALPAMAEAGDALGNGAQYVAQSAPQLPILHLGLILLFAVLLGISVAYLVLARRRMLKGLV